MFGTRFPRVVGFAGLLFALALVAAPAARGQEPKAAAAQDAKKKVKSKLKLTVPQDDTELRIEGKATKLTGTVREFETPDLDAGKKYEYTFAATWKPNNYTTITRTRTVDFAGGEDIAVDFNKVDEKQPQDKVVIRWVPTPDDIVAKMIELAKVGKDDVVYEPGPGDGRVLIAAAKAGAKKAVGIELDPKKAVESREKVKDAGVADKVTIKEGDALKEPGYGEASVIFLYMGDDFNMALRPVLYKVLKPGTRIVSHRFTMGDWAPDKTETVVGADGDEYKLHLWTVKEKK